MAYELDQKFPDDANRSRIRRNGQIGMAGNVEGVQMPVSDGVIPASCSQVIWKVSQECSSCGQALHHHRADDAPPYFTMFIVGHLLVPLVFWVERVWKPDSVVSHAALWLPSDASADALAVCRWSRAAIVGLQWAIGMHGFGLSDEESSLVDPMDS